MAIEVDFNDRVGTYPGRVTLTPVAGQANTYDMARADSPVVAGTPMDKSAFDSIIQSRLTGRYYVPTVTRTAVSNQTGITVNPIPTTWTQVLNIQYTSGGYTITGSTVNGTNAVSRAFDGDDNTFYSTNSETTPWLMVALSSGIIVKKVKLKLIRYNEGSITINVQGSNNASTWDTLRSISGEITSKTEYTLSNNSSYKYYRLSFSLSSADLVYVHAFEISSYDVVTYKNDFSVSDNWPTSWTTEQKALVAIPGTVSTVGVVSNAINSKAVNMILQPNRRYDLRYNGTSFIAKEV